MGIRYIVARISFLPCITCEMGILHNRTNAKRAPNILEELSVFHGETAALLISRNASCLAVLLCRQYVDGSGRSSSPIFHGINTLPLLGPICFSCHKVRAHNSLFFSKEKVRHFAMSALLDLTLRGYPPTCIYSIVDRRWRVCDPVRLEMALAR